MTRKMIVRRSKGGRQALYVSVDPIRPGRDWGSGVEVPSPIMGIVLRSKSAPASVAKPTTFEVADVQWDEGPTIMMKGKPGGGMPRRKFLERAGLAALSAGLVVRSRDADAQIAVPNSSGTESPKLKAPANACDCHMHIYDPARFPMVPNPRVPPTDAAVPQYRLLQKRIGTTRVVIVTPRNYATENQVTVDAIKQLGPDARGVAVLHPTVTDAQLKELHGAGMRGIRFSLQDPATAVVTIEMVEPLSKRVADLGWHVQFNVDGQQVVEWADLLRRIPSQMVFDHLGHPPLPEGVEHPSHSIIRASSIGAGHGSSSRAPIRIPRSDHHIRTPPRSPRLSSRRRQSEWCGEALAAPVRSARSQTERCRAVRLAVRMGAKRGNAPQNSRRESSNAVRVWAFVVTKRFPSSPQGA